MKIIASLTLENVASYDQSGIMQLIIGLQIFSSEGDNLKLNLMLPFPSSPAELSATVKAYVVKTVASAIKKDVEPADIFLAGDLVIDSNSEVADLTATVTDVRGSLTAIQAIPAIADALPVQLDKGQPLVIQ